MPRILNKASDEHEFHSLDQKPFEHFAAALHEAQPDMLSATLYAPDGQRQYGIDHVVFTRDAEGRSVLEVGQSKAYKRFSAADLVKATDKFLKNWESRWRAMNVRKLIVFVGCVVKNGRTHDALIREVARFADLGIELELWDAWKIYTRLTSAPQVVSVHLGRDYHAKLFGDASAPFADLQRELLRGDMGGQRAMGMIARLNQAETAELAELKRRVHRGEQDAVYEQLEGTLHQPGVSDAIAPDVRAGMERLLAALAIAREEYPYAKLLLDRADGRDRGRSPRLRALLMLETGGAQPLLASNVDLDDPGVREVRAVAQLRTGRPALALEELADAVSSIEPPIETLRLASLAHLVLNHREEALTLARACLARAPDMRAARQNLAVALYNAALSPAVAPEFGDWPQPVDLALVQSCDPARSRLEEAERMFASLVETPVANDAETFAAWRIATLTLLPGRRDEAVAAISAIQEGPGLGPAVVAWSMSHALPFDHDRAFASLNERIAADADDLRPVLVQVALANFMGRSVTARSLLEKHRGNLMGAGHREILDYWTAVTELEAHRRPDADVIGRHPWLALRSAMAIRAKKTRLAAISDVMERNAGPEGDKRVLLAGMELLLEAGWCRVPAKHANTLVDSVGTPAAIYLGARALHSAGDHLGALGMLERLDAFPDRKLPLWLDRLRVACLAASGQVLAAAQESVSIAVQTASPRDLWSSIGLHVALGAVPDALDLWKANVDALADPSPGHVLLARAAVHFDPDAARRITAQLSANVPDELLTAAYELSRKLRMSEGSHLVQRMMRLGSENNAGVLRIDSVEQALALVQERQEAVEHARNTYNRGHAPVHMLDFQRAGAIAATYLGSGEQASARRTAGDMLGARYGRRYDQDAWPADRADVRLVADVTALLTAQHLDLLDTIERAFGPIRIGSDTLHTIAGMRIDMDNMHPDRLDALNEVAKRISSGELVGGVGTGQLDPFTVRWEIEGGDPNSTLNFDRLVELLTPLLPEQDRDGMIAALGNTINHDPVGAIPPDHAVIDIELGMAILLEQAGLLAHAVKRLRLHVTEPQIASLEIEIVHATERRDLLGRLGSLYDRVAAGIRDGAYEFVPPVRHRRGHPLQLSMIQAFTSIVNEPAILWVDDRFLSAIDNAKVRVVTTVEVIDALRRYGRLDDRRVFSLRQRLREIDWSFLPLHADEVLHHVRASMDGAQVRDSEDLRMLRRGVSNILRHRRMLQWPDPTTPDDGVRGEVPFLLDLGHMVTETIARLWTARDLDEEAAIAASTWILENLDVDQYPMVVLASDDPRSDQLQGLRLASLLLNGLQIVPTKAMRERQKRYLHWVWNEVVGPRLTDRPEMRASMMEMIEQHVIGADDDEHADGRRLWRQLTGSFLNALPQPLRDRVFSRPAIAYAFGLDGHGTITIGELSIDETDFFEAIAALSPTTPATLRLRASDEQATLSLQGVDASERHILLDLGGRGYRIDDWSWRAGRTDPETRRTALAEREDMLDASEAELDRLNAELGAVEDDAERIRRAEMATMAPMSAWYASFATGTAEQGAFALHELMPESAAPVLAWLRFGPGDTPETAARKLAADRGMLAVIDRIGALPIEPDESIVGLFEAAPPEVREEALDEIGNLPPWHVLFVGKLLLADDRLGQDCRARVRNAVVEAAVDDRRSGEWRLFAALARYVATKAPELEDWSGLDAARQLAFVWAHASKVTVSLLCARIDPASVAKHIEAAVLFSPRQLVENRNRYGADAADPMAGPPARLRARAALGALLSLTTIDTDATVEAALRSLLTIDGADGHGHPCLLPSALAPSVLKNGFLSRDFGSEVAGAFPKAQYSFGSSLDAMVTSALQDDVGSGTFRGAWTYLRQASGDAPLPPELAAVARTRIADLPLHETPDGLDPALHTLIAVAALGAVNGWPEIAERVDHAVEVLWPLSNETEQRVAVFFEIANWRARFECESTERCRVVAEALRRFGSEPDKLDWAVMAARRFAGALAGQDAQPFIDVLADLR